MMPVLTHLDHVRNALVENRNSLVKLEIDERLLQREILKPTLASKDEVETQLAECQKKIKRIQGILEFLVEMETEYAGKTDGEKMA
jgi:hypothetical protein